MPPITLQVYLIEADTSLLVIGEVEGRLFQLDRHELPPPIMLKQVGISLDAPSLMGELSRWNPTFQVTRIFFATLEQQQLPCRWGVYMVRRVGNRLDVLVTLDDKPLSYQRFRPNRHSDPPWKVENHPSIPAVVTHPSDLKQWAGDHPVTRLAEYTLRKSMVIEPIETRYNAPYNLEKPAHLVVNQVIRRLEGYLWDAQIGIKFGEQGRGIIEQMVEQYLQQIDKLEYTNTRFERFIQDLRETLASVFELAKASADGHDEINEDTPETYIRLLEGRLTRIREEIGTVLAAPENRIE